MSTELFDKSQLSNCNQLIIPEGEVNMILLNGNPFWYAVDNFEAEYQLVEWISAAANVGAYLKLGFAYDKGAEVRLGQWIMNDNTAYPFGAAENSGKIRCCFSSPYNSQISYYGTNSTPTYITQYSKYVVGSLNKLSSTFKTGAWVSRNDAVGYASSASSLLVEYTMTAELYLFAQNYNGSPRFGDERRISYFQYDDKDGNLICDLVPCYRRHDNVIGMYDKVRKIFLTNAGSGSFTKGPDVLYTPYINRLRFATGLDRSTIYGANGYKYGVRLSSSTSNAGSEATAVAMSTSGFISARPGDVLRIKNIAPKASTASYIISFDSSNTRLSYCAISQATKDDVCEFAGNDTIQLDENGVFTCILSSAKFGNFTSVRFCAGTIDENTIVTINEEIV